MIKKKPYFLSLALLLCGYFSAFGQESYTITNLIKVPQLSRSNPALVPTHLQHFVGIPLLSGLHASGNRMGGKLEEIALNKLADPMIDYQDALRKLEDDNRYRFGGSVDLFYGGIAAKGGIFTLNFTERVIGEASIPIDLFHRLANEEVEEFFPDRMYDLSSLMVQGMHFKELGLGFTTRRRRGVNWGVRLKFLLGHEGLYSENEQLGFHENEAGELMRQGSFAVRSSGFRHFAAGESLFRLFSARNAGVALDAGFHYQYNKHWEVFGSVQDLGGITWRKDLSNSALSNDIEDLRTEIDEVFDDLVNGQVETRKSFRTSLPVRLGGGARYRFENQQSLSATASARFYPTGTDLGFSLGYHLPVTDWLDWTGSYSIYNNTFTNFGTGLSVQVGSLQFYFASDNVISAFSPGNARNFHFQSGINLLWQKPEKKRRPTANREPLKPEEAVTGRRVDQPNADEGIDYFTLNSQFLDEHGEQEINAIYVDIYRYADSGQKQLIHTSRYPSDGFEVTLYRIHSLHEMTVRAYGYEPLVYQFFPESEGLDREFKLKVDRTSSSE